MKKNLLLLSIFISTIFFEINIVQAVTVNRDTLNVLTYNGTTVVEYAQSTGSYEYPRIPYKYSGSTPFMCITGLTAHAENGATCTLSETLHTDKRIALAYIINKIGVGSKNNYYWTEMAILKYLGNLDLPDSVTNPTKFNNALENASLLGLNKSILNIIEDAKEKQTKYQKNIIVDLSSTTLEFKSVGDAYESTPIYYTDVNGNIDSVDITTNNTNNYKVEKNTDSKGKYFVVKVSKSIVDSSETNLSITATLTAKNSFKKVQIYECEKVNGHLQDFVSGSLIDDGKKSSPITALGTITVSPKKGKITVKKEDSNGSLVAGAKLQITGPNNYSIEITTKTTATILDNLELGEYIIKEISAPTGYITSSESVTIKLSETKLADEVKITNDKNKLEISKTDITTGNLLSGATFEIQDKDGNIIKYCLDEAGKNIECKWVSSDKKYEIEGFPAGTYYLVETSAPEGYELNKEKIKFEIDGKTEVIEVKMENNKSVKVPDTLSNKSTLLIAFAMFNIALGINIC